MKQKKMLSMLLAASFMVSSVATPMTTAQAANKTTNATRYTKVMEYLDRGLVAIAKNYNDEAKGMFLSWRLLGTEDLVTTTFDIYKNGSLLVSNYDGTNYTDTTNVNGSDKEAVYYVVRHGEGITAADMPANTILVNGKPVSLTMASDKENSASSESNAYGYFDIPLNVPASVSDELVGDYSYTANDCSVADVDGDGEYEILVKWDPSNSKDNSNSGYTGNVFLSCYELDGTEVWSQPIDLGKNIRAGAHYTQFMAYDLDGDGFAEIVMKTAPGSTDGNGNYVTAVGTTKEIKAADNSADYRNTSGRINEGPEYLTVFKGSTGEALQTINYTPGYGDYSWGDTYGNRGHRFLAAVGYFGNQDAKGNLLPSVVMCRGYYTKAFVVAYDWDGKNLTQRFYHKGITEGEDSLYGQGNHSVTVSDVDNDGYDELIFGSAVLDHDGTVLSNTELGHGDAMHVNDFNNDGIIEVFQAHEEKEGYVNYGGDFWIPSTGKHIFGLSASGDVGRGIMANLDDKYAMEHANALALAYTSATSMAFDLDGNAVANRPNAGSRTMINSLVYWDGDLGREMLDANILAKYNAETGKTSRFYFAKTGSMPISTNNGTKDNACLTADILGDWREEIIGRVGNSLRVYVSALNTKYKLTTLMHDSQYRSSVAIENVGYNQPPHTSYYVGSASLASKDANYLAPAYAYTVMTTTKDLAASNEYHFDFGDKDVQDGYTGITSSSQYSKVKGYGFTTASQFGMTRAPQNIPEGQRDLYYDQIDSNKANIEFVTDVPNGTYEVTAHYGSWNSAFGTKYTIEGVSSGNLNSLSATTYKTKVNVTDGQLNVVISKGSKGYGGYINGLDIVSVQ